jgi:phosphosulfolactate phosphohydrolase-like enzyme
VLAATVGKTLVYRTCNPVIAIGRTKTFEAPVVAASKILAARSVIPHVDTTSGSLVAVAAMARNTIIALARRHGAPKA